MVHRKDHLNRLDHKDLDDQFNWMNVNFPSSNVEIDTLEETNKGKVAMNVYLPSTQNFHPSPQKYVFPYYIIIQTLDPQKKKCFSLSKSLNSCKTSCFFPFKNDGCIRGVASKGLCADALFAGPTFAHADLPCQQNRATPRRVWWDENGGGGAVDCCYV